MGTFGTGPFGSDGALDLLDELVDQPAVQRREALERVFSRLRDRPDPLGRKIFPDEIVAAAAVVAASLPGGEGIRKDLASLGYDPYTLLVPVPDVLTGTSLLGLVEHLAAAEFGYFGDTFGRPAPDQLTWDESSTDWDLFAQPDKTREFITDRYAGHADIIRELIDGAAGLTARNSNMPSMDKASWDSYCDRNDRAAREAVTRSVPSR